MPLTSSQSIPVKPVEKEPWTFKRIFSRSTAITKTFTNPFDWFLSFMLISAVILEAAERHPSWMFWAVTALILIADVDDRWRKAAIPSTKEKAKK